MSSGNVFFFRFVAVFFRGECNEENDDCDGVLAKVQFETRPSVMEVSPQTFGLSKSILLIDHRIAGDHQIAGDHRLAGIDSLNLV